MFNEEFKATLNKIPGFLCATLYVRDPVWSDEYRLVDMLGLKYPEPMYGFIVQSPVSKWLFSNEQFEIIDRRDSLTEYEGKLLELVKRDRLFGKFADREGVRSVVKLSRGSTDVADVVLFLNFSRLVDEVSMEPYAEDLGQFMEHAYSVLPKTQRRLIKKDVSESSGPLIRILKSTELLARHELGPFDQNQTITTYFETVLSNVIELFDFGPDGGFGTIHLRDKRTDQLSLKAIQPPLDDVKDFQSIFEGKGIASWVAINKQAILIGDLEESDYQRIHQQFVPGIRSQLAVPMIVGNELVGVLNFECKKPNYFSAKHVRTLWYAASQAAIAFQLCSETMRKDSLNQILMELHEVCRAAIESPGDSDSLETLTQLFARWSNASMCDIWLYDSTKKDFFKAAASSRVIDTVNKPRDPGWSKVVVDNGLPVWMSNIESDTRFDAMIWDDDSRNWLPPREHTELVGTVPDDLHPALHELNVPCELGVPIPLSNHFTGVAWLKYDRKIVPPALDQLIDIQSFCPSVGLVIDFLLRYQKEIRTAQRLDNFVRILFRDPPDIPQLDIFAKCIPGDAKIGGDFYEFSVLDKDRLGVVIGDAEDHGVEGALSMLPIFTACKMLISEKIASTHYVLDQINKVAYKMEVRGTAIYFVIDIDTGSGRKNRRHVISGTTAGHCRMLIFNQEGNNRPFPPESKDGSPDTTQSMLGVPILPPLGEALDVCLDGDVLVAFSDGIVEAGSRGRSYGRRSLISAVTNKVDRSAREIGEAILEDAAGRGFDDDATVIVIKFLEGD